MVLASVVVVSLHAIMNKAINGFTFRCVLWYCIPKYLLYQYLRRMTLLWSVICVQKCVDWVYISETQMSGALQFDWNK